MQHSNYLLIQSTYWYNEGMFLVCFHHWQAQGKRNLRDGGLTLASNFRVWQEGNNRIKPRCIHPSEPHLLLFSPPLNNVRKFCIHQWILYPSVDLSIHEVRWSNNSPKPRLWALLLLYILHGQTLHTYAFWEDTLYWNGNKGVRDIISEFFLSAKSA